MGEQLLLLGSSVVTGMFAARTVWGLHRYAYRQETTQSAEVPTISVCIAARNEMHALSQCLERVLASDYPKLEILVLDDSSEDDTPHIIKSFAHAGVRFIPGRDIPAGWLGKNHANQTLAEEASGEYLLFLDVDTTLKPHSIGQLMAQLRAHDRSMVSVLPRREDAYRSSAIFGSMRYHWSLILAGERTPPSASTLWMIKRARLLELEKGLPDYGRSVRPEAHIARQLQADKDYYYLIGTQELGIGVEKKWHSQVETASRLYYAIGGHSVLGMSISLLGLGLLLAPLVLVLTQPSYVAAVIAFIGFASFALFTVQTSRRVGWLQRCIAWPYVLAQDIILLLLSIFKYATRSVSWKGRPVQAVPYNRNRIDVDE